MFPGTLVFSVSFLGLSIIEVAITLVLDCLLCFLLSNCFNLFPSFFFSFWLVGFFLVHSE